MSDDPMAALGPADVLLRIVERRRRHFGLDAASGSVLLPGGDERPVLPASHPFLAAVAERSGRAVIAEVKMGSPRLGSLRGRFDPVAQALAYRDAGAAALSVVVEPDFFHGSYDLLARCREACGLPTLAKDFLVSPEQIAAAGAAGADAILLVAALYEAEELAAWAALARREGLAPLVELHDHADVVKLAGRNWELVGVNNRNLRTFDVELENSVERARELPAGCLRVAESGIAGRDEVELLRRAGFDAFLVGESLLLASDPAAKLRELLG